MDRFLTLFKDVRSEDRTGYLDDVLSMRHQARTHRWERQVLASKFGRDIKVSHCFGKPFVFYSSEFPGCGNGSYGLVAGPKTWLWIEND